MKYYIKPASHYLSLEDISHIKADDLRRIFIDCIKSGKWLTFDFELEEATKLMKAIGEGLLPLGLFDPA